jgi:hypothetical protein
MFHKPSRAESLREISTTVISIKISNGFKLLIHGNQRPDLKPLIIY